MPEIIVAPKLVSNTNNYVNLASYIPTDPTIRNWDDVDKPCDNFTYKGETGLSASELLTNILVDETCAQLGFTDIAAAAAALLGWNFLGTRAKFAGATKGTSVLSKYVAPFLPHGSPIDLPTLVGFPFVGKGVRVRMIADFSRFATRGIPVLGWGLFAWDAYWILTNTLNKYVQISQTSGCI